MLEKGQSVARSLPALSNAQAARLTAFERVLQEKIQAAGGSLPFDVFMQLALYATELGYYMSDPAVFGEQGDFVTAPEISPLFARCIAQQITTLFAEHAIFDILEIGAGSGALAAELLLSLQANDCLPQHYFIHEISPHLRKEQQQFINVRCGDLRQRVVWLNDLTSVKIHGCILANEVLDALPIKIVDLQQNGFFERHVCYEKKQLIWQRHAVSDVALINKLQQLVACYKLTAPYTIELPTYASTWIQTLSEVLISGVMLLFDYGFPGHEFYHPQRHMGTVMCHYQHLAHSDPLAYPSLQDITSHVDFSNIARLAAENTLQVAGFTNQANFLINCGVTELMPQLADLQQQLLQAQQIKQLLLPTEMGELVKVMALTRDLDTDLLGFGQHDQSHRL